MGEAPAKPPLRLCGLCQMWNSRPCGESCGFSLRDPTWEQHCERDAPAEARSDQAGWRPGDKAVWSRHGMNFNVEIVAEVEGWWEVRASDGSHVICRPSSLTAPKAEAE